MQAMKEEMIPVERIQEALRNPGPRLEEVLARWRGHEFVVCVDGQWRLEGFVAYFKYLNEVVAAVEGTVPPPLPPHCFDPVQIARSFRLPPGAFNDLGTPVCDAHTLRRIEDKLDAAMSVGGRAAPSPAESDSLPDSLPTRRAARLLGVDRKTLDKLRRDGWLKWRVKNPTSSRKEFLYDRQSVLDLKNSYRVGDGAPQRRPTRRKARSGYVPQHIKLE